MSFSKKLVICLTNPKRASKGCKIQNVRRSDSSRIRPKLTNAKTYLQEDPNAGTEKGDRPGNKEEEEQPKDAEDGVLGHGLKSSFSSLEEERK